jgi:hypothetical protein
MVARMSRTDLLIAFWATVAVFGARQAIRTFREEMREPAKVWLFLIGVIIIAIGIASG